jgi:hypothetical protein
LRPCRRPALAIVAPVVAGSKPVGHPVIRSSHGRSRPRRAQSGAVRSSRRLAYGAPFRAQTPKT